MTVFTNNIAQKFASVIKTAGMFAIVAALAAAMFPTSSYAASAGDPFPSATVGKIVVQVVDATSGKPLEGAEITAHATTSDLQFAAKTNASGIAVIYAPKGVYNLAVRADGYANDVRQTKTAPGQTTNVYVQLKADVVAPTTSLATSDVK